MKLSLAMAIVLALAGMLTASGGSSGVTYVGHDKVATALEKSGKLVGAPDLSVAGSHRNGAGQPELHDKETDVFYVVDGAATFITGGKMVGGKLTEPGQYLGGDIQGGQVHKLSKGDVIVIPAGIPHWFKEVPHSISYYVVKVLK